MEENYKWFLLIYLELFILLSLCQDVELSGYVIPAGVTVMANMYAIHRDERIWQNPDHFNPSRFIDEDGNVTGRENIMPFSTGNFRGFI